MITFREATVAKDKDKENFSGIQRKATLAQSSTSVGGLNGRKRKWTWPDLYGHMRGMTSMCGESSLAFTNSAYVDSQGKSVCETQKHLYPDFTNSKG